jgi:hypothetical protein
MARVNKIPVSVFPLDFLDTLIKTTKYFHSLEINENEFTDLSFSNKFEEFPSARTWDFVRIKSLSNPTYKFEVLVTVYHNGKAQFECYFSPDGSGSRNNVAHEPKTVSEFVDLYQKWHSLISRYQEAESLLNLNFEKKYADAFYEELLLQEEDYETAPFDPERQEIINIRLQCLLAGVKQTQTIDETEKQDLIEYIEDTSNSLGRLTKKQVMQKLSKIRAKLQKWGPKILKQIGDAVIKELTKIGVEKGMKALGDIFHNL